MRVLTAAQNGIAEGGSQTSEEKQTKNVMCTPGLKPKIYLFHFYVFRNKGKWFKKKVS